MPSIHSVKGEPMHRRWILGAAIACALAAVAACSKKSAEPGAGQTEANATAEVRIGLVAKSLGNGFFDAVKKGGEEAAAELGHVQLVFTGPTTPTAEGQIEVLNSLIAQHVSAIAVSANDPDALVPTLKRAQQRGIKVISYDSAVAPEGRAVHLAPSSDDLIGEACMQLAADAAPGGTGKVAIVSATPTSTNQNAWIEAMKRAAPKFAGLEIVDTVYGDDLSDKSYRETVALLKRYPDLAVIIAPTSVGIVAAAKAVEDQGQSGKVFVTGLGLPSELAGHVRSGTVKSFAIWNPVDLGYAAVQIAARLARGENAGPGTQLSIGRMGQVAFGPDGTGPMSKPFVYDASNIEQFAKVF
jgi:rhamnose transport system substrate-binding protein